MVTKDLENRIKLAKSMMQLNGRCGEIRERANGADVCKARKGHTIDHDWESVAKTIPF